MNLKALLRSSLSGYGLSLLIFSVVFGAVLLPVMNGKGAPQWDAFNAYLPAQSILADHARSGEFLLWNPFVGGGRPDGADPQIGAFSPVNVFVGLLAGGSPSGVVFFWLFVWWLGGFGIVCLAGHLGAPPWSACLGALAFTFSGFQIGHATHVSVIHALSFLPFVVWRLDRALNARRWVLPAAQAGGLWGVSALAGYPAITILNGCFLALWAIGRWAQGAIHEMSVGASGGVTRYQGASVYRTSIVMVILVAVGFAVMVPAYLGFFLEFEDYDVRVDPLSRERAIGSNALDPLALPTFASPYLGLLNFMNRDRLEYTSPTCANIYVSTVVVALALAGLFFSSGGRAERFWRWWLFIVGAVFLMTAMSYVFPFRGWLYDLFPPFRYFRHAAKFRGYYVFCLIVMALAYCRDIDRMELLTRVRRGWITVAIVSILVGLAGLVALDSFSSLPRLGPDFNEALWLAVGLWVATALACVVGSLLPGRRSGRFVGLVLASLVVLDVVATMNFSERMVFSKRSEALAVWEDLSERYVASLDLATTSAPGTGLARLEKSPYDTGYNNANVFTKQQVLVSYGAYFGLPVRIWFHNPVLAEAATGSHRVWFSPRAKKTRLTEDLMFDFLGRTTELGMPPMIITSSEKDDDPSAENREAAERTRRLRDLDAAQSIVVELVEYRPNSLRFWVEAPGDGWLMVTDRYAPGWRSWIDGEEVDIECAGLIFRGLRVTRGRHLIDFEFRPWGHPWLLILSWSVWGCIGLFSLTAFFRDGWAGADVGFPAKEEGGT